LWVGWLLVGGLASPPLGPLFDRFCTPCHGPEGRGDGPARSLYQPPPADLTGPLKLGDRPEDLTRTLLVGIPGTGMPSFLALPEADRAALVAVVRGLRGAPRPPPLAPAPAGPPIRLDPHFGGAIEVQGPKSPAIPPILQTPAADQCGRCHPAVYAAWSKSRHAQAFGPGVTGQAVGRPAAWLDQCTPCHAPVAAQRSEGVGCATCHIRGHSKVGLVKNPSDFTPLALRAQPDPRFGRADLCLPCHNQAPGPGGPPLLDTWREWAASPYLPAGIQCQHCHMPQGDHHFAGAHDPDAVRRAVRVEVALQAPFRVVVRVENVGAGHYFPTTPTPRAVVRVRQLAGERALPETEQTWALGRTLEAGGLETLADTRIPPGKARQVVYQGPRDPRADGVEVDLSFFPDWHYAGVFRAALAHPNLPAAARVAYQQALEAAHHSAFPVFKKRVAL
jgi:hypothetical protein